MSSITHKFEKTKTVLQRIFDGKNLYDFAGNLEDIISDLDTIVDPAYFRYSNHIKELYQFENEVQEWCRRISYDELIRNQIQNIKHVESSVRHKALAPLDWTFVFNSSTTIMKTKVDCDHLVAAIENRVELVTGSDFVFFVRPSLLRQDAFVELPLVDWNLLLVDLFESDIPFTGHEIYELLLESTAFESEQRLQKQVVDFLRIQLIYMNSLTITESYCNL